MEPRSLLIGLFLGVTTLLLLGAARNYPLGKVERYQIQATSDGAWVFRVDTLTGDVIKRRAEFRDYTVITSDQK